MTAKEKATELVEKFKPYVYCYLRSGMLTNTYDEGVAMMQAKSCALIAVDEIIKGIDTCMLCKQAVRDFWQQVKSEIELL